MANIYFQHSIPLNMPSYMMEVNRAKWNEMAITVDNRMWLLETAMQQAGMRGEDFAAAVAPLFDKNADKPLLDEMTPDELASIAKLQAKIIGPQPDRMEWPNCDVVVDTAFTTTREWEMIRSVGLGGSEAAVVMGVSPYQTKQSLYHLKIGTPMKWEPEDPGKEFIFAFGHRVEGLVIETFCKRSGAVVIPETRMFRHKKYPWITANVDGIVKMPPTGMHPLGRIYILEAKTTTAYNRDAWYANKVPPHYVPQCHQYLAVLDDPRIEGAYIGCIYGNTPNDFVAKLVEKDPLIEDLQIQEEVSFWNKHVLRHREPEASGNTELDAEMIRRLSGPADPSSGSVTLTQTLGGNLAQALKLGEQITALNQQVKKLTGEKDELLIPVKSAMGQHTSAVVHGANGVQYQISWKPTKRKVTDLEKLELTYPEVFQDVVTVNPENSRKFSIKEMRSA